MWLGPYILWVRNYKYLGADINEDANIYEEVKRWLIEKNNCNNEYKIWSPQLLKSRNFKITMFKVLVIPVRMQYLGHDNKLNEKKLEEF